MSVADRKLDGEAFPPFRDLLEACQDYAALSGCRFQLRVFESQVSSNEAVAKAAPVVQEFMKRVMAKEEGLSECVERAHRFVMAESVRAGIVATCREVGLWPPRPRPCEVQVDDCAYQDTTAPLPVIAQRAFNDEDRRTKDELLQPLLKRATTASFLVDFVTEAGLPPPTLNQQHHEMLEEFMTRVEEWMSPQDAKGKGSARDALLHGLSMGGATAEAARQQVLHRWTKNWETPEGTLLNLATAGLAIAAGIAVAHRATRSKR